MNCWHGHGWAAAVFALAVLMHGPLRAQQPVLETDGFRSPSGNIHCMFGDFDKPEEAHVRCDIAQISGAAPPRPRDCELEWGSAFAIERGGDRGHRICHGDTVRDPANPVLGYGQVWRRAGLACRSETSGITCENERSHGFALSRKTQRLF